MASTLQGRTALVTGGSRGIGRAIVQRLAADGAAVASNYAREKRHAQEKERLSTSPVFVARARSAQCHGKHPLTGIYRHRHAAWGIPRLRREPVGFQSRRRAARRRGSVRLSRPWRFTMGNRAEFTGRRRHRVGAVLN